MQDILDDETDTPAALTMGYPGSIILTVAPFRNPLPEIVIVTVLPIDPLVGVIDEIRGAGFVPII